MSLVSPIDHKPKRVPADRLRRVQNFVHHPQVAVVIDTYSEDWQQLAWVQIRGVAALLTGGPIYQRGIALLAARYPQYRAHPLGDQPLLVITPQVVRSWQARRAVAGP